MAQGDLPQKVRVNLFKRLWQVIWKTLCIYSETDGEQRAASFAYYAFFSLVPLVLLIVSVGSIFLDQGKVTADVINFLNRYMPLGDEQQDAIAATVRGVVKGNKSASFIAFLGVAWSSLRFFQALVRGVNRAWGTKEYAWWHLPIQNLFMVGIVGSAFLLGVLAPTVIGAVERYWWIHISYDRFGLIATGFSVVKLLLPFFVLFYGFSMFYKFAPRRRTALSEVWFSAFFVALALQFLQSLFVWYAANVAKFNKVYGTFGGAVALLMWIYLSGSVIILGGCLCAAQAAVAGKVTVEEAESP